MLPTLVKLTISAYGHHVFDIIEKLVTLSIAAPENQFPGEYLRAQIKIIESAIQSLPGSLANEVFHRIQNIIFVRYEHLIQKSSHFSYDQAKHRKFCMNSMEIVLKVLEAVLHPNVTNVVYSFMDRSNRKLFTNRHLNNIFMKLNQIKSLTIYIDIKERNTVFYNLYHHKELEEFTFSGCSNRVLHKFDSMGITRLTKLDISGSDVTDASVEAILSFKRLKCLNLMGTYITEKGVTDILNGLATTSCVKNPQECTSCSRHSLRVFECMVNTIHVSLLAEGFPNLTCLGIYVISSFSLLPLKKCKKLAKIIVSVHRFGLAYSFTFQTLLLDLLLEIGQQIIDLELRRVENVDLQFIANNCPSLQKLTLNCLDSHQLSFRPGLSFEDYSQLYSLPMFPTVQCLKVTGMLDNSLVKFLLCHFENLKYLFLEVDGEDSADPLLTAVLERLRNGSLVKFDISVLTVQVCGQAVVVTKNEETLLRLDACDIENVIREIKRIHYNSHTM